MHSRALFDEHWGQTDAAGGLLDPADRRRIATIAALCPRVESVLDVGCGNGEVLQALAEKAHRRAGCDASATGVAVLRRAPGQPLAVQASVDHLPFAARSFTLVSCCDVLEHLPEPVLLDTLQEIMRVAERYILINVPLQEDLAWAAIRCASCGARFHRDHHQRRFLRQEVEELLPAAQFRLVTAQTSGGRVRRIAPLPVALGAALSLGHTSESLCPACGARPLPLSAARTRLRAGFVFCHNALTKPLAPWLTRDTEIIALFERRG